MQRYRLIRERKQYIGVHDREEYLAMREDLIFLQQSLKTVLHDYAEIFKKRFFEGLSIRKTADALRMNRGAVERRQRDEADSICRLSQETDEDYTDTAE